MDRTSADIANRMSDRRTPIGLAGSVHCNLLCPVRQGDQRFERLKRVADVGGVRMHWYRLTDCEIMIADADAVILEQDLHPGQHHGCLRLRRSRRQHAHENKSGDLQESRHWTSSPEP